MLKKEPQRPATFAAYGSVANEMLQTLPVPVLSRTAMPPEGCDSEELTEPPLVQVQRDLNVAEKETPLKKEVQTSK